MKEREEGENNKQVKNDEIVHICGGCRHTIMKGKGVMVIHPLVVNTRGQAVPQSVMVCEKCGVLTYLPEGSVQVPLIEQPKIIL